MLTCKELVERLEDRVDDQLSMRKRIAVCMHLLLCRHCRRYERQLHWVLGALSKLHDPASDAEVDAVIRAASRPDHDDDPARS
jgi:anti-sigma factor RsiW